MERSSDSASVENEWLRDGNADVQQQALKDFAKAKQARFTSGFGEPTWRRKCKHEGFRVIGTDRLPVSNRDGTPLLNGKGKPVMSRRVVVQKLNRRGAQVKVPGCGWVRFRLSRTLSSASTGASLCSSCGFTCNADENAAINVAAGQDGESRPGQSACAGGTTPVNERSSVREPQPTWVGIPLFQRGRRSIPVYREEVRGHTRRAQPTGSAPFSCTYSAVAAGHWARLATAFATSYCGFRRPLPSHAVSRTCPLPEP